MIDFCPFRESKVRRENRFGSGGVGRAQVDEVALVSRVTMFLARNLGNVSAQLPFSELFSSDANCTAQYLQDVQDFSPEC
jgi:hypothetical protein